MAFQFQCPQGHLLEGEESQAGQAINCPVCTMLFIIPDPLPASGGESAPETANPAPTQPEAPAEPELLHIPCPKGHELEVPPEMLDTDVLCPHCNTQFRLRAKDSIEHRRRQEEEEALREQQTNVFWYKFSIGTVIGVVLLLLTLMIMTVVNRSRDDSETKPQESPKSKPKVSKPTEDVEPQPSEDADAETMKDETS